MLYEILTGRAPFTGPSREEIYQRVQTEAPRRPSELWPGVPRALEAVCLKALANKPEDRYASASELAREIDHWRADEPVAALREPIYVRLSRWARKHRGLAAGAAMGILVALIAGSAAALWFQAEAAEKRRKL